MDSVRDNLSGQGNFAMPPVRRQISEHHVSDDRRTVSLIRSPATPRAHARLGSRPVGSPGDDRRRNGTTDAIFSGQGVPTDPKHLQRHPRTIRQGMDSRSIVMAPQDGHFLHFEAEPAGQE